MEIKFRRGYAVKTVKVGYDWWVALLGPFPLGHRGMWLWAIGLAIANIATWGLVGLVVAAYSNKGTAHQLLSEGWAPLPGQDIPEDWGIRAAEAP